ncbi:MAG: sigma-70 family RNA polymerase sigma factor [Lachnospiraceae bacterium]|nr:sigma-70 family RNA polymerase sigma factor [Lachnospiraceae bacterium]
MIDKNKFCNLVLEYENEMYCICKTILLQEKDCCDVVQNTILRAFKALHSLKKEIYFKTWLFRILINECNRMRGKQKRIVYLDEDVISIIGSDKYDYSELYMSIDNLNDKLRDIIILHYINGYTVEELSDMLHIPSGTVKSRLFKARQELKKIYGEVQL